MKNKNEFTTDPFLYLLQDPQEPENDGEIQLTGVISPMLEAFGGNALENPDLLLAAMCDEGMLFECDENTRVEEMLSGVALSARKMGAEAFAENVFAKTSGIDALYVIAKAYKSIGLYQIKTGSNKFYVGVLPENKGAELVYSLNVLMGQIGYEVSVVSDESVWDIF